MPKINVELEEGIFTRARIAIARKKLTWKILIENAIKKELKE